jgi:glycerol uptake facilitator-like aquaporin
MTFARVSDRPFELAHARDEMMAEDAQLLQPSSDDSGKRVDATYPTGYFEPYQERRSLEDGTVVLDDNSPVCTRTRCALEFIATAFYMFFGTLGFVNSDFLVATTPMPGTVAPNNTSGAFVGSFCWGAVAFITLRAFPGVAMNPWVTLTAWWFAHKPDGSAPTWQHMLHTGVEAFWIVCSQLFGAMLALFGVYLVQGRDDRYLGEPFPSALVTHDAYIILYEAAAAFLFWSLVNCYSAPRRASITALEQTISITFAMILIKLCFSGYTGASLNLARTLGVAFVRSICGGIPMRLNVIYYVIGQGLGFGLAGTGVWIVNRTTLLRTIKSTISVKKNN